MRSIGPKSSSSWQALMSSSLSGELSCLVLQCLCLLRWSHWSLSISHNSLHTLISHLLPVFRFFCFFKYCCWLWLHCLLHAPCKNWFQPIRCCACTASFTCLLTWKGQYWGYSLLLCHLIRMIVSALMMSGSVPSFRSRVSSFAIPLFHICVLWRCWHLITCSRISFLDLQRQHSASPLFINACLAPVGWVLDTHLVINHFCWNDAYAIVPWTTSQSTSFHVSGVNRPFFIHYLMPSSCAACNVRERLIFEAIDIPLAVTSGKPYGASGMHLGGVKCCRFAALRNSFALVSIWTFSCAGMSRVSLSSSWWAFTWIVCIVAFKVLLRSITRDTRLYDFFVLKQASLP